ncbi:MAG: tetraacyldisaccharide 4'-kinase [Acidobacteriaceae bacterium]
MSARRGWGRPLVPVYAAALRAKDWLRDVGVLRTQSLAWPVISVGSLSAGGAGKTPVVIALAKLLRDAGWNVDVLSRGYGREGRGVERVHVGLKDSARRFGDEPVLIAEQTGVPVWVGADRFAAGERAEAEALTADGDRNVHLLDDGFQHRRLGRSVDVVLVTSEDLDDALLPGGNLRESVSALQRADVVVVRQDEVDADKVEGTQSVNRRVWAMLRERGQMWTVRRSLVFPAPLLVFGAGLRPIAFCGIARPEGFAAMLHDAGCGVIETVAFPDHHRYNEADVERLIGVAKSVRGSGFVTTEKDAVKLTGPLREQLEAHAPVMVVTLEAVFADGIAVLRSLEAKLSSTEAKSL